MPLKGAEREHFLVYPQIFFQKSKHQFFFGHIILVIKTCTDPLRQFPPNSHLIDLKSTPLTPTIFGVQSPSARNQTQLWCICTNLQKPQGKGRWHGRIFRKQHGNGKFNQNPTVPRCVPSSKSLSFIISLPYLSLFIKEVCKSKEPLACTLQTPRC